MAGSDSLDDENFTILREAMDKDFITDSMYSKSVAKVVDDVKPKEQLKSLRNSVNEDDEQYSTFKVTPQFQNHVARHLEKMLDKSLTKQLKNYSSNAEYISKKNRKKCIIKLLSDSKHCLTVSEELVDNTALVNNINAKRKINKNYDSDEDLDKCRTVAVDAETVLAQTEVFQWAKRKKKNIFEYKKLKDGKLHMIM